MINNNTKDITPTNSNGQRHGYWEIYWTNDRLWYKGHYKNSKCVAVFEAYRDDGTLYKKHYYNHKGNEEGISVKINK